MRVIYVYLVFSLLLLLAASSLAATPPPPRTPETKNPPRSIQPYGKPHYISIGKAADRRKFGARSITDEDTTEISMRLTLDWTAANVHLSQMTEPLSVEFCGTIEGSESMIWKLCEGFAGAEGAPTLHYVSDVYNNTYVNIDYSIMWHISIDGEAFQPLLPDLDGQLSVNFSPGFHTFTLLLDFALPEFPANGHYQLLLAQGVVPQL